MQGWRELEPDGRREAVTREVCPVKESQARVEDLRGLTRVVLLVTLLCDRCRLADAVLRVKGRVTRPDGPDSAGACVAIR